MKFSVAAARSVSVIEAARVEIRDGSLIFSDEQGMLLVAFAPGHWNAVRQVDLNIEAKAA